MNDDFSFTPIKLSPTPEGPFGLAGESKIGLGSKGSITSDQPNRGTSTPPFEPPVTGAGFGGGGGGGAGLPSGGAGYLLRHNGSSWVAIAPSLSKGILINNAAGYSWVSGAKSGDMLYYNGSDWIRLVTPESGTYVLGSVNGNLQYIPTEGCDEQV